MRLLSALLLVVALLVPAAAAQADDLSGAREVLALTQQRLSYMETVAAAKWATRAPIQDPAQEATPTWLLPDAADDDDATARSAVPVTARKRKPIAKTAAPRSP